MFQDIARALRAVADIDANDLMRVAYQAMLASADAGLTSDAADDDDMQVAIAGQIADWLENQHIRASKGQGYPAEPQRERITALADLLVTQLWNHRLGRSAATAREQQREILLAIKATLTMPTPPRKPGRPSQGRGERIQAMVSEQVFVWVNGQRRAHETMSDVVDRLFRERMATEWEYIQLIPLDQQRMPNSDPEKDRIEMYKDADGIYHHFPGASSLGLTRLAAYRELSKQGYERTDDPNLMRRPVA